MKNIFGDVYYYIFCLMKRWQRWLLSGLLFFSIWLGFLLKLIPIKFNEKIESIIPLVPLWILVTFGSYSLANIAIKLMTFNDATSAYHSLQKEIKEARADLKSKNVSVTD